MSAPGSRGAAGAVFFAVALAMAAGCGHETLDLLEVPSPIPPPTGGATGGLGSGSGGVGFGGTGGGFEASNSGTGAGFPVGTGGFGPVGTGGQSGTDAACANVHCEPRDACLGGLCLRYCQSSFDCTDRVGTPLCDDRYDICVECTENADCLAPGRPRCASRYGGYGVCVECNGDEDCDLGGLELKICKNEGCVPTECRGDWDCGSERPFCDRVYALACRACLSEFDCEPGQYCDAVGGYCR